MIYQTESTVVFNVRGSPCGFQSIFLGQFLPWKNQIIWNFPDCTTTLTVLNVDVIGTILAPYGTLRDAQGHLTGAIIASAASNSRLEISSIQDIFQGCVSKCGDGVLYANNEECDDGNMVEGDGCDSKCRMEEGWNCPVNANGNSLCGKKNN